MTHLRMEGAGSSGIPIHVALLNFWSGFRLHPKGMRVNLNVLRDQFRAGRKFLKATGRPCRAIHRTAMAFFHDAALSRTSWCAQYCSPWSVPLSIFRRLTESLFDCQSVGKAWGSDHRRRASRLVLRPDHHLERLEDRRCSAATASRCSRPSRAPHRTVHSGRSTSSRVGSPTMVIVAYVADLIKEGRSHRRGRVRAEPERGR